MLDSRFNTEESTSFPPPTRITKPNTGPKKTTTSVRPPVLTSVDTRFKDRDDPSVIKRLTFDSKLSEAMEKFAIELLLNFNARLDQTNFMISPFSIYHLLVLIAEGAKGNTFEEIKNKLGLDSISKTRDFQQYLSVALK